LLDGGDPFRKKFDTDCAAAELLGHDQRRTPAGEWV